MQDFFKLSQHHVPGRHRLQLQEWQDGDYTDNMLPSSAPAQYITRSVLGLVSVYNRLPAEIVESSTSVSDFQSKLQDYMKQRACSGDEQWPSGLAAVVPARSTPGCIELPVSGCRMCETERESVHVSKSAKPVRVRHSGNQCLR